MQSNGQLEEFFDRSGLKQPIRLLPNFGNAGDSLIAQGTIAFFAKCGVRYRIIREDESMRCGTIVFAGGGALVGYYKRSESLLLKALQNDNHVIVLPHTIRKLSPEVLKLRHNLSIFCRELESYRYLESLGGLRFLGLDHDMAFFLGGNTSSLLRQNPKRLFLLCIAGGNLIDKGRVLKKFMRAYRSYRFCARASQTSPRVLNCFRTDVEKAVKSLPADNCDISNDLALGSEHDGGIRFSSYLLLSTIARFDEVRTDRLHCCIAAILLGKAVTFYSNSYFKNRAVYDFSIRSRAANVEFVSVDDCSSDASQKNDPPKPDESALSRYPTV